MKVLHSVHFDDFKNYQTDQIRDRFLVADLLKANELNCAYTHYDRMIAGIAHPVTESVTLGNYDNLKSDFFFRTPRGRYHQCRRRW